MRQPEPHPDGRYTDRRRRPPDRREPAHASPDLLRTSDVASLFQVSSRTVSEWARQGRVPCMRTPGGQWRYPAEPIRRLLVRLEHLEWDDGPEVRDQDPG